eukprot:UC4_evm4s776
MSFMVNDDIPTAPENTNSDHQKFYKLRSNIMAQVAALENCVLQDEAPELKSVLEPIRHLSDSVMGTCEFIREIELANNDIEQTARESLRSECQNIMFNMRKLIKNARNSVKQPNERSSCCTVAPEFDVSLGKINRVLGPYMKGERGYETQSFVNNPVSNDCSGHKGDSNPSSPECSNTDASPTAHCENLGGERPRYQNVTEKRCSFDGSPTAEALYRDNKDEPLEGLYASFRHGVSFDECEPNKNKNDVNSSAVETIPPPHGPPEDDNFPKIYSQPQYALSSPPRESSQVKADISYLKVDKEGKPARPPSHVKTILDSNHGVACVGKKARIPIGRKGTRTQRKPSKPSKIPFDININIEPWYHGNAIHSCVQAAEYLKGLKKLRNGSVCVHSKTKNGIDPVYIKEKYILSIYVKGTIYDYPLFVRQSGKCIVNSKRIGDSNTSPGLRAMLRHCSLYAILPFHDPVLLVLEDSKDSNSN